MNNSTCKPLFPILRVAIAAVALACAATALLFNTAAQAQTASSDATLSALTVSPRDIIGFDPARTVPYEVGVASTVTAATVTATPNHTAAAVVITPADADDVTAGHQVSLAAGRNEVTFTVTAKDSSTRAYTVAINRGVTADGGWKAVDDLDGLITAGNDRPWGIWSDGTTMWVADGFAHIMHAYRLADGARQPTSEFNLDTNNGDVGGIWSDGTTMWVADWGVKVYAYRLADGARQPNREFNLDTGNSLPLGIWSDGTTMWVADWNVGDKLYAYRLADGARQQSSDLALPRRKNNAPRGIWSDRTTMWVADSDDAKVYAYRLADGGRQRNSEFNLHTDNSTLGGMWSDGTTMWVADWDADKVFSYDMPPSSDATLSALTVSPRDIIGFDPARTEPYEVGVASTVTAATLTATPNHAGAVVVITPADADDGTAGHQVSLAAGRNEVTFTVTAEDSSTGVYTVAINRGVTADGGWKAVGDLDGLITAGNYTSVGIWSDGTTMWVADGASGGSKVYAYLLADGAPQADSDFTLDANNSNPQGIWSDGTTMWVADGASGGSKVYAYLLADGAPQADSDFTLDANNSNPQGIWSDDTTMWVADGASGGSKVYAYLLADGAPQADSDFTLDANNSNPQGIWSDDTTMWVADGASGGSKVYAYLLADGAPQADSDFTLDANNSNPQGIWSDDTTMWVANSGTGDLVNSKIFSYNLPLLLPPNAEPTFDDGVSTMRMVPENSSAGTSVGTAVAASDSDNDSLVYSLGGADAGLFEIDSSTGQIRTRPNVDYDYEAAKRTYQVTVEVHDNKDAAGSVDDTVDASITVSISLTNEDDAGTVTIVGTLQGGVALTAVLDDPDGSTSSVTWQWAQGSTATGNFASISGATDVSYTPTAADVGLFLQATAMYTDPLGGGKSASGVTGSTVGASNSAPTFDDGVSTMRMVPENSSAGTSVGTAVAASDSDNDSLVYSLGGADAGLFEIDSSTGQIRTRPNVDYDYEAAKRTYQVTVEVHDNKDAAGSVDDTVDASITVSISLTNEDDAGTVTIVGTLQGGVALTAVLDDPDGSTSSVTWQWAQGSTATGNFASISGATDVSYTPTAADVGLFLQATAMYTDPLGGGKSASGVTGSTVGASNSAPTFDDGVSTMRMVPENSSAMVDVGLAVAASDSDNDSLVYSLGDADAGLFEIDSSTGQIRTRPNVDYDYEAAKRTYQVTVEVHDNKDPAGGTDDSIDATIDVTISLTNVNEAPVLEVLMVNVSVEEKTLTSQAIATYSASDPDADTVFTWMLEGPDADLFDINVDGELEFANVPDYEVPTDLGGTAGDNVYIVMVKVTDDGSPRMSDTSMAVSVTVTDVNEAPVITSAPGLVSFAENGTGAVVDFEAMDVDAMSVLTWSVESADDGSRFGIDASSGALTFMTAPDFEAPTDVGDTAGNNTYMVTVKVTDNGIATDRTLRRSDTHTVVVTVTNVNEAPVITTGSADFAAFVVDENTATSTVIKTYEAMDPDASTTLAWSLEGDDADDFVITKNSDGDGELRFAEVPDFEDPADENDDDADGEMPDNIYEVTVVVADDHSPRGKDMLGVEVTVEDFNETPQVSGDAAPSFAEIEFDVEPGDLVASDYVIGTYTATDDDGDSLSWDVTGPDAAHFAIHETTGVLSFAIEPDFENPADQSRDNFYDITVRAKDNLDAIPGVGKHTVRVEVTQVDETPEITTVDVSHAAPVFAEIEYDAEAADLVVADYHAVDEEGEEITWSLGGGDASAFGIDPVSGVLSFGSRPDYEMSTDSAPSDNVYAIVVKATDAAPTPNVRELIVNVEVADVDERPEISGDGPRSRLPRDPLRLARHAGRGDLHRRRRGGPGHRLGPERGRRGGLHHYEPDRHRDRHGCRGGHFQCAAEFRGAGR